MLLRGKVCESSGGDADPKRRTYTRFAYDTLSSDPTAVVDSPGSAMLAWPALALGKCSVGRSDRTRPIHLEVRMLRIRRSSVAVMLLALTALVCVPSVLSAQTAEIAGVVRDASGAVLPGVTVEASSPALIEKWRVVFTDGQGQYRVIALNPGAYKLTFTLPGFNTVAREGIVLTAAFTATVDVALSVGSVEETVTVSGQTPLVDIQATTQRRALTSELLNELPRAERQPLAGSHRQGAQLGHPGQTHRRGQPDDGRSHRAESPLVLRRVPLSDVPEIPGGIVSEQVSELSAVPAPRRPGAAISVSWCRTPAI